MHKKLLTLILYFYITLISVLIGYIIGDYLYGIKVKNYFYLLYMFDNSFHAYFAYIFSAVWIILTRMK